MGEIPRADPASSPRIASGGDATRGPAIWREDSAFPAWEVEVVPLEGVTTVGNPLGGGGLKPRATFEVRVEFEGDGLRDFEPYDGKVKRVECWTTRDLERARALAIAAAEELRAGREVVLVQLANRF